MSSPPRTQTPNVLTTLGFKRLSEGISVYQPIHHGIQTTTSHPTLIIICPWAFSQPKHISKYITPYQTLYPFTCILLVQNAISNAIWKPDTWQMTFFQPAASYIQSHLAFHQYPGILLHAFSNGGSHAAVQLSQACRETCGGMRMPVDALILDSCPGLPRFWPTIAALTQGIPSRKFPVRSIGTVLAYVSVGWTALWDALGVSELAARKLYRRLNDPADVFLMKRVSGDKGGREVVLRVYFYSKSDEMIMEEDVLGHAGVAASKLAEAGFGKEEIEDAIRVEEFVGTAHVNHVKYDADRYWKVVQDLWRRTVTC